MILGKGAGRLLNFVTLWAGLVIGLAAEEFRPSVVIGSIEGPIGTQDEETNIPPRLAVLSVDQNGWRRIGGEFRDLAAPPKVFTLQSSGDLVDWGTVAVLQRTPFEFCDPGTEAGTKFYRMVLSDRTETNDWSNQVWPGERPFFHEGECATSNPLQWAKFLIDLEEPNRVYFQDVYKHLLHYEFAVRRIPKFSGMTAEEFTAMAMRRANQQVILGAILLPYDTQEYGIQILGLDPYPREMVAEIFQLVRSAVASTPARAIYLPSYEQEQTAWENQSYFESLGIEVGTVERWGGEVSNVYSTGWAVGILKFIPAAEIMAAYADGRLGPKDILLTDRVPAELPFVAGIISLAPATPNSHAAILAQSYEVPFVYLAKAEEQSKVKGLAGLEVMLRTGARLAEGDITIVDLGEGVDPELKEEILALKAGKPLQIQAKEPFGKISAPAETLVRSDVKFFGGKAANFGLLRRVIPENSPEAIGISFDLWDAFMEQVMPSGMTLRAEIAARLGGFSYPPNIPLMRQKLAEVKDLITRTARFSSEQQEAILATVGLFDQNRNIRFRSSTNVEDTEQFTGAGLYDSYSGCAADDLDGDSAGPSICDPTEKNERGVFRAIQKVYASFYNENAFLERLRHGVDETKAGMALLVHHSTPDEFELANGVANLKFTRNGNFYTMGGSLVTQVGAISVANPEGGARPEVVNFTVSSSYTNVSFNTPSSLVQLGTKVMQWPQDYEVLSGLIGSAAKAYAEVDPNRAEIRLDFEFKKVTGGDLRVKQIREIPFEDPNKKVPTFMLSTPQEFYPIGEIMAMHRMKSRWRLTSGFQALKPETLSTGLYTLGMVEYRDGNLVEKLEGPLANWPGAGHSVSNSPNGEIVVTDEWTTGTGGEGRNWQLKTSVVPEVYVVESPMRTLKEPNLELTANYATAMPVPTEAGGTEMVTAETVQLIAHDWSTSKTFPIWFAATNKLGITGNYQLMDLYGVNSERLPNPECDLFGRKDQFAFVARSGETRIEGLVSEPIILRGELSQTFVQTGRFGHQVVHEGIFDPWLEAELPEHIKEELTTANIRLIYYYSYSFGNFEERWRVLGLDGRFRDYP